MSDRSLMQKIWDPVKYRLGRWAEGFALVPMSGALAYDLYFGFGFDELFWIATMAVMTRLYAFARWTRERDRHDTFWGRKWVWLGDQAEWVLLGIFVPAYLFDMNGGIGLDELWWFIATGIAVRLVKFARWARKQDEVVKPKEAVEVPAE